MTKIRRKKNFKVLVIRIEYASKMGWLCPLCVKEALIKDNDSVYPEYKIRNVKVIEQLSPKKGGKA